MLPDFGGILDYMKEAGQAILTIVMIGGMIYFGAKREIGRLIGTIVVLAIFILIVKNPDETILQFAEGLIKKLLPGK
ncbi:hypothetical protein HMPREF0345_2676 [Enterococcus faecalis ATCC 29200]|uniref:TcpD family membrane protein n=1 Tax=Enterococcus faecalis TaxID=1351 RepID=UPI00019F6B4E|nr:TcpD family membrane protein [Enterococcus faecalis]EEN70404.1 hypothetical protein HMPREF0345_2676 [Enterococcus faecalis ATCC 29200]EOJ05952.1 hypothetical protein UMK_02809 [Enterococcus faecalis ATCC 29200]HDT7989488.1 hypothetical protein [Enterococcus faecalis]HDT8070268.1 hypothetical protein [Enterococcus faecalis]